MATYSNRRINPITGATAGRAMVETFTIAEFDFLPGVYGVLTTDGIVATTLSVTEDATGGVTFTEVTGAPLVGQVSSNYSNGFNAQGILVFNVADNGKSVDVVYTGYGSTTSKENMTAILVSGAIASANEIVHVYDSKAASTSGGTFTSGAPRTRDLTNLDDPESVGWCSIGTNQITLTAGKYEISWSAPAYAVDAHHSSLYNITDAAVEKWGSSMNTLAASFVTTNSIGMAMVDISVSTVYEIQHECLTTKATNGFGQLNTFSAANIYTQVNIRKIG